MEEISGEMVKISKEIEMISKESQGFPGKLG